jgi:dTDP-4-dehydrorhamnose 3,5-epimerase
MPSQPSRLTKGEEIVKLPSGVLLTDLAMHGDSRGVFTEAFRMEWSTGIQPVQWNVVSSRSGVLRGVHVHPSHDDYLIVISGTATVGLRDLRRGTDTTGLAATVDLSGDNLRAITIPHGVAHGFLFHESSTHLYAVSRYWDTSDELACFWGDEELGIDWPVEPSLVSERDASAQSLKSLLNEIEQYQPF